jgi:hypothetical protein
MNLIPASMPAAQYWRRTGRAFFLFAGVLALLGVLPIALGAPDPWIGTACVEFIAAVMFVRGLLRFRKGQASHPESVVYSNVAAAPPALQAAYWQRFRKMAPIATVFVLGLSAWQVHDLLQLERGEAADVRVWWPVALLYDAFGFWVAILALPLLWAVLLLVGLRKAAETKRLIDSPPAPTRGDGSPTLALEDGGRISVEVDRGGGSAP